MKVSPPVIFLRVPASRVFDERMRQQNLAVNQQVNNAVPHAVAESEIENRQIKLLEATDGERMDIRSTSTTSGVNQALETVGEIDRPEDRGG